MTGEPVKRRVPDVPCAPLGRGAHEKPGTRTHTCGVGKEWRERGVAAAVPPHWQLAALQLQVNGLAAQVNGLAVQVAALPTLAQIQAALAAALVPHNAPAVAAAAAAIAQAIASGASRARNAHDRDGEAYTVVPRDDGTPPPNWPAGFHRSALVRGNIAVVNALLADYMPLPLPATARARRDALATRIGTMRA